MDPNMLLGFAALAIAFSTFAISGVAIMRSNPKRVEELEANTARCHQERAALEAVVSRHERTIERQETQVSRLKDDNLDLTRRMLDYERKGSKQ